MSPSIRLLLFLLVAAPGRTAGQTRVSGPSLIPRRWEIGLLAGAGPSAVVGPLGGVPHRHLVIGSLYASRPILIWKSFAAGYIGEVFPLLIATRVPRVTGSWFFNPAHTDSLYGVVPDGQGVVPGMGVLPVGLRLSHRVGQSALLFADASGGAAAFTRAMPEPDARALNFLGSVGFGVQLGKRTQRYLLGYRFTHMSNAYTAKSNPGFNAHILYFGLTIR